MARTNIPPGIRWKVFARDGFRCRYCGAQGGDAVLVVDHTFPVSRGGDNRFDNLITACEACNQGKSDHLTISIPELQSYVDTAETMVGWLVDAFCREAGVTWAPSFSAIAYVVSLGESFADAEAIVRCVASQIREGTLSTDKHTFYQIMRALELYVFILKEHPHKADQFWSRIDHLLAADQRVNGYEV